MLISFRTLLEDRGGVCGLGRGPNSKEPFDPIQRGIERAMQSYYGVPLGGIESLKLPGSSIEDPDKKELIKDFCRLLGPLVPSLMRDEKGSLDLKKIKTKSFEEFRKFLADQAAINDNITIHFRRRSLDPFKELILDPKYKSLFRYLYQQIDPDQFTTLGVATAKEALAEFEAELVEIDADAFVKKYGSSKKGRFRLSLLLSEDSPLQKDERCDLIKAVYRKGKSEGVVSDVDWYRITNSLSLWNYFNISVTDDELEIATDGALSILKNGAIAEESAERNKQDAPESIQSYAWVAEGGETRYIDPKKIERFNKLVKEQSKKPDAISQAQVHLAKLWLMTADRRNWKCLSLEDNEKIRAYILEQCERLINQSQSVSSSAGFEAFQEKLQEFLHDPVYLDGNKVFTWLEHQTVGAGLSDLLEELPAAYRSPFDQLVQLSDTWKYSLEMDERVMLVTPEIQIKDPKQRAQVSEMIAGLEKMRHALWYGYKQHKALSRGLSQVARIAGRGDVINIRKAQEEIKDLIDQLSQAKDKKDLREIGKKLFDSLKKEGVLYKALKAADMDGTEQFLGLVQTIGLIIATSGIAKVAQALAKGGGGLLARILGTAEAVEATEAVAATVETATVLDRMAKGFKLGAQISTAENALAVATGEVRDGPEAVGKWFKDVMATGLSMALTGMLPISHATKTNPLENLWARYTIGWIRGARYFLMDTGIEVIEESVDAYVRQVLDGKSDALTWGELREIMSLCLMGGGFKVGVVAEHIKGETETSHVNHVDGNSEPTRLSPTPKLAATMDTGFSIPEASPSETEIHLDGVALDLQGPSQQQIAEQIITAILQTDQIEEYRNILEVVSRRALKGAKVGVTYPTTDNSANGKKSLIEYYLLSFSNSEYLNSGLVLIVPGEFDLNNIQDPDLRSKITVFESNDQLPEISEPGRIYIVRSNLIPINIFSGLMAFSELPSFISGDGAPSAAITGGKSFF